LSVVAQEDNVVGVTNSKAISVSGVAVYTDMKSVVYG
jgi:hypothetical protein